MELQAEGEGNPCTCGPGTAPSQAPGDSEGDPQAAGHHPWMPLGAPGVLGKKTGRLPRKDTLLQLIIYILTFFLFTSLVSFSIFCCNSQIVRLQ